MAKRTLAKSVMMHKALMQSMDTARINDREARAISKQIMKVKKRRRRRSADVNDRPERIRQSRNVNFGREK